MCFDDRIRIVPPTNRVDGAPVPTSPRTNEKRGPMPNACAAARPGDTAQQGGGHGQQEQASRRDDGA